MYKIKTILVIAAFCLIAGVHAQPAVLPAQVDVSAIGAATYTIPIEVVPGTNGIQPNLAIGYNSMSGLSVLGSKWGLQGISAITRTGQSAFYDGDIKPIGFGTSDRFALDGQRLLLFSGSSYQNDNAVYCFEVEDFSRVTRVGMKKNFYFKRTLADGSVIEYGSTTKSRLSVSNGKYLSWMMDKVVDLNGNCMTFHYQQSNGEIWIDHIDYTKLADGTPAYASVTFEYTDMTNPNDVFMNGFLMRQSKLLTGIVVKYQGNVVRKYSFVYNSDLQYERLSKVKLYDASQTLLSSTTINWITSPSQIVSTERLNEAVYEGDLYAVPGHFNDDRIYDILLVSKSERKAKIILNNVEGFEPTPRLISHTFPSENFEQTLKSMKVCDIDDDGIDEIIYLELNDEDVYYRCLDLGDINNSTSGHVDASLHTLFHTPLDNEHSPQLSLGDFDGDGIVEPVIFPTGRNVMSAWIHHEGVVEVSETKFPTEYESCLTGDFNGDGKTDLMFLKGLNSYIYSYNLKNREWKLIESNGFPNACQYIVVGDYNGDGLSDVLFLPNNESQWKMAIRKGKGTWTWPVQIIPELDGTHDSPGSVDPKYTPFACDINGDGKSDILQPVEDNKVHYLVSMGCKDEQFQYSNRGVFSLESDQSLTSGRFSMGDLDGNGVADILFSDYSRDGKNMSATYFYRWSLPGLFVDNIADEAGKTIKFQYSTISLMPSRFVGSGMNWVALPMVKNMYVSNGLGDFDVTSFYYGDAQFDRQRHQFVGFGVFGQINGKLNKLVFSSPVSDASHGSFAMLMPDSVVSFITMPLQRSDNSRYWSDRGHFRVSENSLVSRTVNTYSCLTRTNVSGNVSVLPYTPVATTYDFLKNVKSVTETSMNSSTWLPKQVYTHTGYITGNEKDPFRQYVDHTYSQITLENGATVMKPTAMASRDYNSVSSSNPRRNNVSYTYTDKGQLLSKTSSDNCGMSVSETYSYNANGLPVSSTTTLQEGVSRQATMAYDPTSRFVTRSTDHAGNVTQCTYDPSTGLRLSQTDAGGLTVRYEYDSWGRPTKTSYPDGTKQNIQYTKASGGLANACCYTTVTENGKPESRVYYDILGRKTHTYVAGQGYMDIVYNSLGQVSRQTQVPYTTTNTAASSKKWKTFLYDDFGRLVKDASNYQENTYSYRDNNSGHLYQERVVNKMGAVSTKYYDAAGRVVRVIDNGVVISYTYDRVVQDQKVCDRIRITHGGKITTIVTDSRGNRLSLTDPDAGTTTSTYDPWGNLLTQTDGKGDVTTMTYNNLGRIVSKSYSLNGKTDAFSYIYGTSGVTKGKVTKVSHNSTLYQQFSYDAVGRVASVTKYINGVGYTHQYSYNSNGQLYTTTYPSGFVLRHEYDDNGQLRNLRNHSNDTYIYTIDSRNTLNQPNRCRFANGTGVAYSYNDWGLPTQIRYGYMESSGPIIRPNSVQPMGGGSGQMPIGDIPIINPISGGETVGSQYSVLQYSYNDNGYITRKRDAKTGQQEDFTYDLLGRLTSFSVNNANTATYTYSDNGNIVRNSRLGNADYTYDPNKPHAVTMVVDEQRTLPTAQCDVSYNSRNRAATISENGWKLELTYGSGLQREKAVLKNGNTTVETTYFISKDCERIIKPSLSRYLEYIYADGKIVAIHVHNTTANADSIYYVHTDLLGSWERIVDRDKNVVQSSHFDPWGNRMSATNWTQRQDGSSFAFHRGFTGHEHYDRFGIINMNARLYDPALGRFFSPDPQVQAPFSSQGFNRYSYCGNNPVMRTDPDGEFWHLVPFVAGFINLKIHSDEGDVKNFWQGLGYFTQGFIGGTLSLPTVPMNLGITAVSMIRGNSKNALRIFMGQYYYDENMAHGFLQAFTRFGIERLQTQMGFVYTQAMNCAGKVSRVDYFGGATFSTDEYAGYRDGITMGNNIHINNNKIIEGDFHEYVLNDNLYQHEYGHTIDGHIWGIAYLTYIGIPSLVSCSWNDIMKKIFNVESNHRHSSFYSEKLANFWGSLYFERIYGTNWDYTNYPVPFYHGFISDLLNLIKK